MKRFLILCAFSFCCSLCYAIESTPTGPGGETVPLKRGHFGTGLEYVFADEDVKTDEAFFGGVRIPPTTVKKIQLDRIFFVPSYALFDNVVLFGRLGGTRMDIDHDRNRGSLAGQIGTSDWGFAAGGGARIVLYKKDRLTWILSGVVTWTEVEDFDEFSTIINGIPVTGGKTKIDQTDYQFATGPAYEILDGWTLSAGPFFQFIDGKAKVSAPVQGQRVRSTIDIDEDDWLGGYVSSQLKIARSAFWNARFSATGSGYIIATAVTINF
jgi:hypothetical protein